MFIRTPWNERILVDAGRSQVAAEHIGAALWGTSLDYVVISHFDADHFAGLPELIMGPDGQPGTAGVDDDGDGQTDCVTCPGEYMSAGSDDIPVAHFIDRGMEPGLDGSDAQAYKALSDGLRRKAIVGEYLSKHTDFEVRVVSVDGKLLGGASSSPEDENSRSISVYVRYGEFGFLVTGDLPAYLEQELAYELATEHEPVTVLMLGHHGSDTSTSQQTLSWLKPHAVVVSVGDSVSCGPGFNAFGHPTQEVLDTLSNAGVPLIVQTEEGGAKPESGSCTPATGETYPRDYHTMTAVKSAGDITVQAVPGSYRITYSGR